MVVTGLTLSLGPWKPTILCKALKQGSVGLSSTFCEYYGYGDACDICDNANVFVTGNVNGDLTQDDAPIVDFFDIVSLIDYLQQEDSEIFAISAEFTFL